MKLYPPMQKDLKSKALCEFFLNIWLSNNGAWADLSMKAWGFHMVLQSHARLFGIGMSLPVE
jgi:hypothetical protein